MLALVRALSAFLIDPFRSAWQRRGLVRELSRREIEVAFAGSVLGAGWLFLQPLLSLAVYALVFGGILGLTGGGGNAELVSRLFTGMIVYQAFAGPASQAAHLVLSRPNYVTKVVFPLHLLAWPAVVQAALNAAVSTVLLVLLHLLFVGAPAWTVVLVPVALGPALLLGLGASWVLSSLGVYVRDTAEVMRVTLQLLFFLCPVVWTLRDVPSETVRTLVMLNPLAIGMETCRALLTGAPGPGIAWVVAYVLLGWLAAAVGYTFFRRTQDGFADVL
jgi:lipopolysaccharide transport system permease protein